MGAVRAAKMLVESVGQLFTPPFFRPSGAGYAFRQAPPRVERWALFFRGFAAGELRLARLRIPLTGGGFFSDYRR